MRDKRTPKDVCGEANVCPRARAEGLVFGALVTLQGDAEIDGEREGGRGGISAPSTSSLSVFITVTSY